ncbi:MAG TPA: hypothetical protein VMJ31_04715 [Methylocystis sp.]|nr:hypothetical protein [Methylocystis sp.]
MADISIGRLSINVPATPQRGEKLARLIADGLAAASLGASGSREVSDLTMSLRGLANESDEALAERLVAELVARLDRSA